MTEKETTTMEEIVDSATQPEKITQEELNKLQVTIRTMDRLTADVGRVEVQKHLMMEGMKKHQDEVNEHRTNFMEKYGTDNVNIQTGAIAYTPEQEQALSNPEGNPNPNPNPNPQEDLTQTAQENGEADKED